MDFNSSLSLRSFVESLSSGLTLHIHLVIISSFLPSLISSSSLTGPASFSRDITLHVHAESNLPFPPKRKPLLANKDTKSLNLRYPSLILVVTLSNALPVVRKGLKTWFDYYHLWSELNWDNTEKISLICHINGCLGLESNSVYKQMYKVTH